MADCFEVCFACPDPYVEAVDKIEQKIFFFEANMFLAMLVQELRLLEAFSGERSKHNLGYGLWEVAEDVIGQVVAT